MFLGLHLLAGKNLLNDAFFVDDKGGADGTHSLLTNGQYRLSEGKVVRVSP